MTENMQNISRSEGRTVTLLEITEEYAIIAETCWNETDEGQERDEFVISLTQAELRKILQLLEAGHGPPLS